VITNKDDKAKITSRSTYFIPVFLLFSSFAILFINGCKSDSGSVGTEFELIWERSFSDLGTHSSPRAAADLNGDGVMDIVLGSGMEEMASTPVGIMAISGANGDTLWTYPARDQVFGSPTFLDITQDGNDDIIISGRAGILIAIEGSTGSVIWEYMPDVTFDEARDRGILNFYNPQVIPDQNNDGLPDLIVANGGDYTVPPYDDNRPAGKLMIISASDGDVIAAATVPDGKETYMSAVVAKLHPSNKNHSVIFGTGGETIGGSLYIATLNDIMSGDLSGSVNLATGDEKGFIAPPLLADLNGDNYLDIVANAVDGRTLAFSGKDYKELWNVDIENTEVYGSLSAGAFITDSRTDIYTTYSIGVWPNLRDNYHILIQGETGEVLSQDTLGVFQTATPIAADLSGNGYPEALQSVNIGYEQFNGSYHYNHMLVATDFRNSRQFIVDELQPGANLSSTPWAGDLDRNNRLDIVYVVTHDEKDIFGVSGFTLYRLQSRITSTADTPWGSYMGRNFDGIFLD
jgi:outer membrane protein assembly factor BamB